MNPFDSIVRFCTSEVKSITYSEWENFLEEYSWNILRSDESFAQLFCKKTNCSDPVLWSIKNIDVACKHIFSMGYVV